jgi:hypothetical protein
MEFLDIVFLLINSLAYGIGWILLIASIVAILTGNFTYSKTVTIGNRKTVDNPDDASGTEILYSVNISEDFNSDGTGCGISGKLFSSLEQAVQATKLLVKNPDNKAVFGDVEPEELVYETYIEIQKHPLEDGTFGPNGLTTDSSTGDVVPIEDVLVVFAEQEPFFNEVYSLGIPFVDTELTFITRDRAVSIHQKATNENIKSKDTVQNFCGSGIDFNLNSSIAADCTMHVGSFSMDDDTSEIVIIPYYKNIKTGRIFQAVGEIYPLEAFNEFQGDNLEISKNFYKKWGSLIRTKRLKNKGIL